MITATCDRCNETTDVNAGTTDGHEMHKAYCEDCAHERALEMAAELAGRAWARETDAQVTRESATEAGAAYCADAPEHVPAYVAAALEQADYDARALRVAARGGVL